MKNVISLFALILMLYSCKGPKAITSSTDKSSGYNSGTPFILIEISSDNTYGFTEQNPIMVGGVKESVGPANERRFLDALAGPNREPLTYVRLGGCCPVKSANGFNGFGMLDKYEVKWDGQDKPVILYINMYDYGPLKAPKGFTIK